MQSYANSIRFDGRVALVTGAAGGLGSEIARALSLAGASVVASDRDEAGAQSVADAIRRLGGRARGLAHDVVVEQDWERVLANTIREFGGLDVLVNNAGIETAALLSQCSVEDFRRTLDVNVIGVFLGIKHAVRAMSPGGPAGRGGSIVNLSSAAGLIGVTGHAAYCASKGGVRLLTKAAAVECAQLRTGIRVNSIHPAIVPTAMGKNFLQDFVDLGLAPDYASAERSILALHPMGHFGKPDDVAGAVLYLASDLAKWVTGAELAVDGGLAAA